MAKPAPNLTGDKVAVFNVSTGAELRRWPVDARELIATGEYTWQRPGAKPATPEWAKGLPVPASTSTAPTTDDSSTGDDDTTGDDASDQGELGVIDPPEA